VRYWARERPADLAFLKDEDSLTWGELDARSEELAVGMYDLGIRAGDVVGILMENGLEYIEAYVALIKLGAITAPFSTRLTPGEVAYQVEHSDSKIVLTEPDSEPLLGEVLAQHPQVGIYSRGSEKYPTLASLRKPGTVPPPGSEADDTLVICYTSGTTGYPKGAMLTHASLREVALANAAAVGYTWRDRVLAPQPFHASGGLGAAVTQFGLFNGCRIYIQTVFDPGACLKMIERERISLTAVTTIFLERMARHPDFASCDLTSLLDVTTGGAVISKALIETYLSKGVRITQGYGLTESSIYVAKLPSSQALEHPGTVGRPIMYTEVRVVDDDVDCPADTPGEILVRGPGVMAGYWKSPEQTAQALRGGWLHTGDVGELDQDGYLTIRDRKKDMIISGGFNVYPAEIERIVSGLAGLSDSAVIGVPDEKWGEVGLLVVGDTDGSWDLGDLGERLSAELARYKWPRYIARFGEALPRNGLLKVDKKILRTRFPALSDDFVVIPRDTATADGDVERRRALTHPRSRTDRQ
jgi:fatty-acyl-CoA synthase